MIVCGEPQFEDGQVDTPLNPTVLFEVLCESTEDYDRGKKFANYRTLPSLREYVLVAQDRCHVEQFTRQPDDRWILWETDNLEDAFSLPSSGCTLKLSEIYAKVTFSTPGSKGTPRSE